MKDYSHIISLFQGVKKTAYGWSARCPAHEDRNQSATIRISPDGDLWLRCHAGCSFEEIRQAMNVSIKELFADDQPNHHQPTKRDGATMNIKEVYDYCDESGKKLFQCVRLEPKDFRQRHQVDGKWVWTLEGVRRVVFNLPALIAAPGRGLFIVEGEKDVRRLQKEGLLATCNPMGAGPGKWLPEFNQQITAAYRDVVILPDVDPIDKRTGKRPGEDHIQEIAKALFGEAKSLRVIWLPGLHEGQDVSDWFELGHTVQELRELIEKTPKITTAEELDQACVQPAWTAKPASQENTTPAAQDQSDTPATGNGQPPADYFARSEKAVRVVLKRLAEQAEEMPPVDWCLYAEDQLVKLRGHLVSIRPSHRNRTAEPSHA